MERKTKRLGAGVASIVMGCALAIGCSAAPEEATGAASQPIYVRSHLCPWVNSNSNSECSTSVVPWGGLTEPDLDLMNMGCDFPTVEAISAPSYGTSNERYTSCPSGSAAVARWVAAYSGSGDGTTRFAHFNDSACDACIPYVPSGRDYVFYDQVSDQPVCQGCPDPRPPPPW